MGTIPDEALLRVPARLPLAARVGIAALVLAGEKLLLNAFVDFDSTRIATGLPGVVRLTQHIGFRFLVSFFLALALFAYVQQSRAFAQVNRESRGAPIRWAWLLVHGLLVAALVPPTYLMFGEPGSHIPFALLLLAWALLALLALTALLSALAPWSLWRDAARSLGIAWLYAGIGALVAAVAMQWSERLWEPTAGITFQLVRLLLAPLLPALQADPLTRVLSTGHFAVQIAEVCSGLEGVGLMLAFCAAWLLYFRKEYYFPRALILVPIGVALVFALNVLRIAVLILIGDAGYPDVAVYGFHSQAGWIAFNCAAGAIVFASRKSRWLHRHPAREQPLEEENATAAYVMPFLAILAAGMLSRALSGRFETLYPLRVIAAAVALYAYRGKLLQIPWRCSWRGPAVGAGVFALWLLSAHFLLSASAMPAALAAATPLARDSWLAARVLGSVITVPIAEELAYRGWLMRRIRSADFETVPFARVGWLALIGSAVIFGLGHGALWPVGILTGIGYGALVMRTGQLGESVAAHVTTNLLLSAAVLLSGQWQLW